MLLAGVLAALLGPWAHAENWPGWRGPRGDGTSIETDVPVKWDVAEASWKVKVPGVGHASPIVWGDRVFTVTSFPQKLERTVLCFDRGTGKMLWQQPVVRGPLEPQNRENSHASATPATDGSSVYVAFRVGDEIVVAAHDVPEGSRSGWSGRGRMLANGDSATSRCSTRTRSSWMATARAHRS